MTILNPKEVSALLKDLEPDSPKSGAGKSDFGTADFQKNQKPQKAALLKTNRTDIPAKIFIPPQFKPKNTSPQIKIFENLYPALETVLAKLISFLQITIAEFSKKKTIIVYQSVIRTRFKDFSFPENAVINTYLLEPTGSFVFFSLETLLLESLFQAKVIQAKKQNPSELSSKKIKELHKILHKDFLLK